MMTADELREAFLSFYGQRGHVRRPSDSLVPTADPTLLFTGAGMNQFKEFFLGRGRLPFRRATTSQKCLRTGDIENVGRTASHHTFFEMLGNFSFGDYFKREAIHWAWELSTQVFRFPKEKLLVSVYKDDDEAHDIWFREIGLPAEKILRFDAKENFWPADAPTKGPNGPCGTCTEIFYDQGEEYGCDRPDCDPSCDCDRYVEFYNLVFTQFDRQPDGSMPPLPQKNIDTGLGFERTLALIHGKPNNFETELFMPVIKRVVEICGKPYVTDGEDGRRFRRIADHARAVAFCISDGVLPSNEGRGYVVRRLLRTATVDGRALGIEGPFLYQLVPVIGAIMGQAYPDMVERRETIARIVKAECEKFAETLENGTRRIREIESRYADPADQVLSGVELFQLMDTYGMPPEASTSVTVMQVPPQSREEFNREMEKQREQARRASTMTGDIFVAGALGEIRKSVPATEFCGYKSTEAAARVLAVIRDDELVNLVEAGDEAEVTVLPDRTCFYAEQGGQVGDTGVLRTGDMEFTVTDTRLSPPHILHVGKVTKGTLRVKDEVEARVDAGRRQDIRRNHTATHLLHAALRDVLGEHAEQSGSLVAPDHFRFDFHHFEALTRKQLDKIERFVNEKIIENVSVTTEEMDLEAARQSGAKALFGEKYDENVRVVGIEDFSKELCGGTHCERTGDIGQFKITGEESAAAGIRRITAVTGRYALDHWKQAEEQLREVAETLKSPVNEVANRARVMSREVKSMRKELDKLRSAERAGVLGDVMKDAETVGDVKLIITRLDGLGPNELRQAVDLIKRSKGEAVAVLASVGEGKVQLVAYAGKAAQSKGLHAGELIKAVARKVGGGGGGRPEMAMAGGTRVDKTKGALELARKLCVEKLADG